MTPVGILGGMGPAAGAELARRFVQACEDWMRRRGLPIADQAYPEHVLLQVPFDDRTAALRSGRTAVLEESMSAALRRLEGLGVAAVALACNTAHAWHAVLQQRHPAIELLDVGQLVADELQRRGIRSAGLLATEGTYLSGIYQRPLQAAGVACSVPAPIEQAALMRGIYAGVKAGRAGLARTLFAEVANAVYLRGCVEALILGCTEIPLALAAADLPADVLLLDPAALLADALAERAFQDR